MPVENSLPVTGHLISNTPTLPPVRRPRFGPRDSHPVADYTKHNGPIKAERMFRSACSGVPLGRQEHAQKSLAPRHHETGGLAPASRVIASIIAAGLATPLPAMSNALPCATEENRIGLPIAKAADWLNASSFAAM